MKITVTFDSMEEFQQHMTTCAPAQPVTVWPEEQPAPEPVKDPEPAPAPEPEPEPVKITEDFRAEVRRAMATLNKQTGENTAKKLLQERGFASLKDAPLEALPELMETVRGMVK